MNYKGYEGFFTQDEHMWWSILVCKDEKLVQSARIIDFTGDNIVSDVYFTFTCLVDDIITDQKLMEIDTIRRIVQGE